MAVWNCSRGRPGLESSPGSAFSRVQVTGMSFKCINTKKRKKIKKIWPGLLSSSQASEAVSFAQDLPISVSCLGQGNTQGTHTGLAKVKVSNRHPVVCKSHPVEDPCSLFKRAWPPIATVQSQPSAHQTSGWRTDSHPKASLSCTSPQKCHEVQAAPPSSCSSGQHKGTTAPAR